MMTYTSQIKYNVLLYYNLHIPIIHTFSSFIRIPLLLLKFFLVLTEFPKTFFSFSEMLRISLPFIMERPRVAGPS